VLTILGNAAILKGGKESIHTSSLLVKIISEALAETAIPPESIAYLTSREQVTALLSLTDSIDLVIPRGSNALVSSIQNSTRIPVMGHADGRCNIYLDSDLDVELAGAVVLDSKIDYPAACNAVEALLVNRVLLSDGRLAKILSPLVKNGVELRCENDILEAIGGALDKKLLVKATENDMVTEFLDKTIYIRSVDSLDEGTCNSARC
jgi:glutamate-5-semialdehyde dehydrogenase